MFSRKKPEPVKHRQHNLSQFGLMEIPDDFDPASGYGDDDGGSDLEAELAAITSGSSSKPKTNSKPKLLPSNQMDKLVADSLRDMSDDDSDDAELENDADLLNELQTISGEPAQLEDITSNTENTDVVPQSPEQENRFLATTTVDTLAIIKERIEMYRQSEINAKNAGEAAKARRFNRGLKTLQALLNQVTSGKIINVDEIPPEVGIKSAASPTVIEDTKMSDDSPKLPTRQAPDVPISAAPLAPQNISNAAPDYPESINSVVAIMRQRQAEYKSTALEYKRKGDTSTALQFLKVVKQFDVVIKMCEEGHDVDLSDMPPKASEFLEFLAKMQNAEVNPIPMETPMEASSQPDTPAVEVAVEDTADTPSNMLEALQQRLNKYKSVEDAAKAEGNSSKARRFGRIVKQYDDAIKSFKAGRSVAYDELPVPPGFGPLPIAANDIPTTPASQSTPPHSTDISSAGSPTHTDLSIPSTPKPPTPRQREELTTRVSGNQQKNNLAEQQMKLLLERQREFKLAAIEAKKAGEIDQAKEYLKIFKGFDALLNAASSGLPVDLNTLPIPPSQRDDLEGSFAIVSAEECDPNDDIADIGVRMEEQLAKQLMMCKNTRDHHKAMGDVAGMNRFENLALTVQKDLDLVRFSKRKNFPLPKFHYEKRNFNIVHCNTDLTSNELEIIVVRGIKYNVPNPKDVDTYVRVEFPLLNDESFKVKTNVIRDTDSPDYDERFKVEIQRGNRQFQRIFKRHGVKFEVYSRGGFLRSDTLIGTVNAKLQPLETKCDIHDTYNLMEGRKQVGGKLEIKVRIRNPILTKQIESINEKWLVLEHGA